MRIDALCPLCGIKDPPPHLLPMTRTLPPPHHIHTHAHTHNPEYVHTMVLLGPGCNCRGICLANSGADNYVVKFPVGASPADKAALLSSLFLINLLCFERRGNQK